MIVSTVCPFNRALRYITTNQHSKGIIHPTPYHHIVQNIQTITSPTDIHLSKPDIWSTIMWHLSQTRNFLPCIMSSKNLSNNYHGGQYENYDTRHSSERSLCPETTLPWIEQKIFHRWLRDILLNLSGRHQGRGKLNRFGISAEFDARPKSVTHGVIFILNDARFYS